MTAVRSCSVLASMHHPKLTEQSDASYCQSAKNAKNCHKFPFSGFRKEDYNLITFRKRCKMAHYMTRLRSMKTIQCHRSGENHAYSSVREMQRPLLVTTSRTNLASTAAAIYGVYLDTCAFLYTAWSRFSNRLGKELLI